MSEFRFGVVVWRCHERKFILSRDQVARFSGANVVLMVMGDKDCSVGMPSSANEEPLGVVKIGVDVMREIIGQNSCDGGDGVIQKWEAPLCCGRDGSCRQGSSST